MAPDLPTIYLRGTCPKPVREVRNGNQTCLTRRTPPFARSAVRRACIGGRCPAFAEVLAGSRQGPAALEADLIVAAVVLINALVPWIEERIARRQGTHARTVGAKHVASLALRTLLRPQGTRLHVRAALHGVDALVVDHVVDVAQAAGTAEVELRFFAAKW
jgi:hypothetical protein